MVGTYDVTDTCFKISHECPLLIGRDLRDCSWNLMGKVFRKQNVLSTGICEKLCYKYLQSTIVTYNYWILL